jgi:hypothetical protein
MKTLRPLLLMLAVAAFAAPVAAQDLPTSTPDGLERRVVPGVDITYVRPGADISGYDRVRLGPVSVSFRKNFERDAAPAPNRRVSESDLQGIRERLGGLLHDEVAKALKDGGFEVTDATGDDVMQLDLAVLDLYLALVPQRQGADEVMAFSTGEMLLEARIADSISGEPLARIYDIEEGRVTNKMHRISRGENEREAREIATRWAGVIVAKLDAAKKNGPAQ